MESVLQKELYVMATERALLGINALVSMDGELVELFQQHATHYLVHQLANMELVLPTFAIVQDQDTQERNVKLQFVQLLANTEVFVFLQILVIVPVLDTQELTVRLQFAILLVYMVLAVYQINALVLLDGQELYAQQQFVHQFVAHTELVFHQILARVKVVIGQDQHVLLLFAQVHV